MIKIHVILNSIGNPPFIWVINCISKINYVDIFKNDSLTIHIRLIKKIKKIFLRSELRVYG